MLPTPMNPSFIAANRPFPGSVIDIHSHPGIVELALFLHTSAPGLKQYSARGAGDTLHISFSSLPWIKYDDRIDRKPILALTMGDPVGVGPEIIVKALVDARIYQVCRPLVLGDLSALERARLALDPALKIHLADRPAAGHYQLGTLDLMPLSQLAPGDLKYGRPTRPPAGHGGLYPHRHRSGPGATGGGPGHRAHQQDSP